VNERSPERAWIHRTRARLVLAGLLAITLLVRGVVAVTSRVGRRHAPPPVEGPFRVLMVAMYPEQFTGTKYRLAVWAQRLRRRGFEVDLVLTMPNSCAARLANDWSLRARTEFHLRMLRSRLTVVWRSRRAHAAVVHMNDLPFWDYGPPFVAAAIRRRAGRLILDLDDLPLTGGQVELTSKAQALGGMADGLSVGNRMLPDRYRGKPWWLVPTCVEPSEWSVPDRANRSGPPLLGWVGTPGNLRNLDPLAAALAEICDRHGTKVRIVCSEPARLPGVPEEFVPWSAAREQADLASVDIGLAPLVDAPKQRYKCGLKALQYMASGMPVVASPVGVLSEIVRDGETGLLATTPEEWAHALDRIITDKELRLTMGKAGRLAVERDWSFARHEESFIDALRGRDPHSRN